MTNPVLGFPAMVEDAAATVLRDLAERYAAHLRSALGDRLVSVVLFGSVARGDASPSSDIDLLIVAEGLPSGHLARKRMLASADAAFERDLASAAARGMGVCRGSSARRTRPGG